MIYRVPHFFSSLYTGEYIYSKCTKAEKFLGGSNCIIYNDNKGLLSSGVYGMVKGIVNSGRKKYKNFSMVGRVVIGIINEVFSPCRELMNMCKSRGLQIGRYLENSLWGMWNSLFGRILGRNACDVVDPGGMIFGICSKNSVIAGGESRLA